MNAKLASIMLAIGMLALVTSAQDEKVYAAFNLEGHVRSKDPFARLTRKRLEGRRDVPDRMDPGAFEPAASAGRTPFNVRLRQFFAGERNVRAKLTFVNGQRAWAIPGGEIVIVPGKGRLPTGSVRIQTGPYKTATLNLNSGAISHRVRVLSGKESNTNPPTRKDFEAMAKTLRERYENSKSREAREAIFDAAGSVAETYKSQNPRFDKDRFMRAAIPDYGARKELQAAPERDASEPNPAPFKTLPGEGKGGITLRDRRTGLTYKWRGGHTVNVFREAEEVDVFSVGDFAEDSASVEEVRAGIQRHSQDVRKGARGFGVTEPNPSKRVNLGAINEDGPPSEREVVNLDRAGPGKFEGGTDLDRAVTHAYSGFSASEETGDVDEIGFFAERFKGPASVREIERDADVTLGDKAKAFLAKHRAGFHLTHDPQGFVTAEWFDRADEEETEWNRKVFSADVSEPNPPPHKLARGRAQGQGFTAVPPSEGFRAAKTTRPNPPPSEAAREFIGEKIAAGFHERERAEKKAKRGIKLSQRERERLRRTDKQIQAIAFSQARKRGFRVSVPNPKRARKLDSDEFLRLFVRGTRAAVRGGARGAQATRERLGVAGRTRAQRERLARNLTALQLARERRAATTEAREAGRQARRERQDIRQETRFARQARLEELARHAGERVGRAKSFARAHLRRKA